MTSKAGVLALLGLAAGLALTYLLSSNPKEKATSPSPAGDAMEQKSVDAALARIAAESRGELRAPLVQAAPRIADNGAHRISSGRSVPAPPDGYSFVTADGEMAKGPLRDDPEDPLERADVDPHWTDAPDSVDALVDQAAAAGRNWSFGWVRLALTRRPDAAKASLRRLGVDVLGASGELIRARLPGDAASLRAISALPEVAALGAVPREAKLPEAFVKRSLEALPHEQVPVFITLMANDPDGRWRRALTDLGAVVGRFDPAIRVYSANVTRMALDTVAGADFVLAVEPIGVVRATHDTAVPAMGADALRDYSASSGRFSGGGASTPVGVMDTGLNINHLDIASNRESVCGANFVFDKFYTSGRIEDADLWVDRGGHGTHVTGTIAGNGAVEPRSAGMAPSVSHIRFAKVLDVKGIGNDDAISRGMDFLATSSGCPEAGWSVEPVKPLIVNMSLAGSSAFFEGRGASTRKLDSIVWRHRQLYVVAQSNEDIRGFSNYGTAKNSLAVGAVSDSGHLATFSSHGPTADGRLAPQVVATGVDVRSTEGGGSRDGYVSLDGTSMASPSVAGVAALLMDAVPAHREQPALTRARLMASAVKPDAWLDAPDRFPADNTHGPGTLQAQYGLGKVSARTSVLNRNRADGWTSGGATSALRNGEYAHRNIRVPENASRLDIVMTWDEPPTDTLGAAVLNDLDLWLDRGGDCGGGSCGEHSSTSRKDNVEWIIVRNPPAGVYRAKVVPNRVYTAPPRAALAWTVIRGASTPQLGIEADRGTLSGGGRLTLTVTADGHVAAGTKLHFGCRDAGGSSGCASASISEVSVDREDSVSREPPEPWSRYSWAGYLGSSITLGEIGAGESQEVRLLVEPGYSSTRLHFTASAWNGAAASTSVAVPTDADGSEVAEAERPANDDFAAAAAIAGKTGVQDLDLMLATPEPGEPAFWSFPQARGDGQRTGPGSTYGRPTGSVWYAWTAPASDLARFALTGADPDAYDIYSAARDLFLVNVEVFRGNQVAELERVAAKPWSAAFFAEKGLTYYIRVSNAERGKIPLTLRWSQGPRPANDDLDAAAPIEGAAGVAEGTNQGATLELGESVGGLAATTWHRWTAPRDGAWRFESDHFASRVLAFTGDAVAGLRLVSGFPRRAAEFPARAGTEYRIAVAVKDAYAAGISYELTWEEASEREAGNDDFQGARELAGGSSGWIAIDQNSTVEPGEPVATGVRTKWWVWTAPGDGRFTWRLNIAPKSKFRVAAFAGAAIEDLRLVGAADANLTSAGFTFDAVADRRYWISAGLPAGDGSAFAVDDDRQLLLWGPTPQNDDLASAVALSGASGSVTGSNRFATIERGERVRGDGHSSLWWTWEASASGWFRFRLAAAAPAVLVVYRSTGDGDGPGSLELVRSSAGSDAGEVSFQAERGVQYHIRLGTEGDAYGGDFTIGWEAEDSPVLLKYVGRLADGDTDSDGDRIELPWRNAGLNALALNGDGTALYAAAYLHGLHVFRRDPETGDLGLIHVLDGTSYIQTLIWDPRRNKLYGLHGSTVRKFAPVNGAQGELRDEGELKVTGSQRLPSARSLFMDSAGSFLYLSGRFSSDLAVFAFDAAGDLRHVQTPDTFPRHALISNDDSHVYARGNGLLLVFERDAETGRLTEVGTPPALNDARAMAISDDDRYLFAVGDRGETQIFGLEDPSSPRHLDSLPSSGHGFGCKFAATRNANPAIDVFCADWAFSVQWRSDTAELVHTDVVSGPDSFNNGLPTFNTGIYPYPVASPDGKHIYTNSRPDGIAFFERIGNELVDVTEESGAGGFAPADQTAFDARFVGKRLATGRVTDYIDFLDGGRFDETFRSTPYHGTYVYRNTGPDTGTVTLTYSEDRCDYRLSFDATAAGSGQYRCSTVSGTIDWRIEEIGGPAAPRAPSVEGRGSTTIRVGWPWSVSAGRTYAFDLQARQKDDVWWVGTCLTYEATSSGQANLQVDIPELESATTYQFRYRLRGSSSCDAAIRSHSGRWSAIGEGRTQNDGGTGGGGTRHGIGDTITSMPTGFWVPDTMSGASVTRSGSDVTVRFNNGGHAVENGIRYTCDDSGGCRVMNRVVELGVIVEATERASGVAPGVGSALTLQAKIDLQRLETPGKKAVR